MKTENKISTFAIMFALCAGVTMPASAAPSVRSLGGSGTYSSAANAAQGVAPSAPSASATNNSGGNLRGGAMRVDSGGTIGSVRASSSRAASAPRLSIGKYLTTSQTVSGGGSGVRPLQQSGGDVSDSDLEDIRQDITNIYNEIENIQNEFNSYIDKEYTFDYDSDTGMLTVKEGDETVLEAAMVTFADLQDLEDRLNALIERHVNEIYAEIDTKQDKLTPGTGITIDENNVISSTSTVTNIKIEALENAIDSKQDALTPGTAISISDDNTISVNVGNGLAVDTATNTLNVTFDEGVTYSAGTGITIGQEAANTIAIALTGGNGIKVNGATISMDTPNDSGNYFYNVGTGGVGTWSPFEVVDASALTETVSDGTVAQ